MKIKIPFNDWSKQRLKAGVKTATSRNKRYGDAGDIFKVRIDGNNYRYELLAVFPMQLSLVSIFLYHIEGAESPLEFVNVWCDIHKRVGWTPEKIVQVHLFKVKQQGK